MKNIEPDTRGDTGDTPDPWVQEGLRALREQVPSEESRRATLAQLGIAEHVAVTETRALAPVNGSSLWRWVLGGVLLGVLALVLRRWLG